MDIDDSGLIHYTEFLAATLETQGHIEEERLAEAFDRLDADDSGYITKQNLRGILGTEYTKEKVETLLSEADIDQNGKISFEEFVALFRVKHGAGLAIQKEINEIKLLNKNSSNIMDGVYKRGEYEGEEEEVEVVETSTTDIKKT